MPHISVERPWTEIAQVAQDLIARRFPGKAVLTLDQVPPLAWTPTACESATA